MQVMGTVAGGVSQANSMKYQAKVAEQNAQIDRAASRDALERGSEEEARQYRRNAAVQGAQRAAMAANGIDVDFGSAADLQLDTKRVGWQDAQTVRENANRESSGYEINAWNNQASAVNSRYGAKATMWATAFDAGGQILGAAQQYRKGQAARNQPTNLLAGTPYG